MSYVCYFFGLGIIIGIKLLGKWCIWYIMILIKIFVVIIQKIKAIFIVSHQIPLD